MKKLAISIVCGLSVVACSGEKDSHSGAEKPTVKTVKTAPAADSTHYVVNEELFEAGTEEEVVPDDEARALLDEEEAEAYDEYAYEEETEGSIVAISERSEGYIEWHAPTEVAYSQADVLVVTPDGQHLNLTFAPGEAMVLDQQLPDGLYQWESVISPEIDSYAKEEMRAVRESGDQNARAELAERLRAEGSLPTAAEAVENRQAGAFVVMDGVATPTFTNVDGYGENEQ